MKREKRKLWTRSCDRDHMSFQVEALTECRRQVPKGAAAGRLSRSPEGADDERRECGDESGLWPLPRALRPSALACRLSTGQSASKVLSKHFGTVSRLPDRIKRNKGVWWMPRRQEAMKDVALCDKPGGGESTL